jgi:very-short-patch-repair endonuclease
VAEISALLWENELIKALPVIAWVSNRSQYDTSSPLMGEGKGGGGQDLMENIEGIAKTLRKSLTDSERKLWKYLRAKQLEGLKFRRQEPIGHYVVDFVCYEKRLIIEVDGEQHVQEKYKDDERDGWLREQGFKVLRFWDSEVLTNTWGVLELIRDSASPSPNPSRQGRGNR